MASVCPKCADTQIWEWHLRMALPLGYHRDDEVARVVATGEIALAIILIVIGIALLRRLEGPTGEGPNRVARIAAVIVGIGITAYALYRVLPDEDPSQAFFVFAIRKSVV